MIKHSAAATATVTVGITDRGIEVDVADPGPRRAAARGGSNGHGLIGLDERVRLVGGELRYEARDDGFCVHAALPLGPVDDQGRGGRRPGPGPSRLRAAAPVPLPGSR